VYVAIASMLCSLKLKVVRTPRSETTMFHSDVVLSMTPSCLGIKGLVVVVVVVLSMKWA
jgi:hypothetical protein